MRTFQVTIPVTKSYTYVIEANTPEEAEAIADTYMSEGEEGFFEHIIEMGQPEAIPVDEGGDGDLIPDDLMEAA